MEYANEIKIIIEKIYFIINKIESGNGSFSDIINIKSAVSDVNDVLYHSGNLKFQKEYDFENKEEISQFIEEVKYIISLWQLSNERRNGKQLDVESWEIYECFKYVLPEIIFEKVKIYFNSLSDEVKEKLSVLPKGYPFLTGRVDCKSGDYSLVWQHINMMSERIEDYRWLYDKLCDYRSKKTLNDIIKYWFTFNHDELLSNKERAFTDYFDLDIVECDGNSVIVDLGAYIGDSIADLLSTYRNYKRIYAYEITPSTFKILKEYVGDAEDIILIQKGVSSKCGKMYIDYDVANAGLKLLESGEIEVKVTTLDEDIKEPISIIKMDIEGAEKDALIGAKNHIVKDRPQLLISTYHIVSDIFEVPRLIDEIRGDYKYYMRLNGEGIWPCDYVLYAV